MKMWPQLLTAGMILFLADASAQTSWQIIGSPKIYFDGSGADGFFSNLDGKISFDPDNLTSSSFAVSLMVSSIDTGNKTKNNHALDDNWLDAEKFPKIIFKSSKILKTVTGYVAQGALTLHGVVREVEIPFTFTEAAEQGTFQGVLSVDRKNFGLMGNFFGFLVGDIFAINIQVPVERL